MQQIDPESFIITRKRKKYRFALFANSPLCFEEEQWLNSLPPVILEVGAGTGLFSVALAENNPAKEWLAVDVKADRLQKGASMAAKRNLTNIRFLRSRADLLPGLLPACSLESIWVTFPDPFPRKRAAKHRLTHPRFLKIYTELLQPKGALYFKTDASELFTWSLEQLVSEGWKIEELSFDLHESFLSDDYKMKTTYETRFINEGLKINFVKATPSNSK